MEFPETEIAEIKKFMNLLNSQKNCAVVVEGKRDSAALVKLGYSGKILEFHRFNGMIKFADVLNDLKPDLLVVLGDRFELISATYSALIARIPVAHFHGGEATEGLIDEATRHSITKMSHLHFVANKVYKKRVIQLGENPKNVFNVGGTGIDNINKLQFYCYYSRSIKRCSETLDIEASKKSLYLLCINFFFIPCFFIFVISLESNISLYQVSNNESK